MCFLPVQEQTAAAASGRRFLHYLLALVLHSAHVFQEAGVSLIAFGIPPVGGLGLVLCVTADGLTAGIERGEQHTHAV